MPASWPYWGWSATYGPTYDCYVINKFVNCASISEFISDPVFSALFYIPGDYTPSPYSSSSACT